VLQNSFRIKYVNSIVGLTRDRNIALKEKRCTAENLRGEISDLWERGTFPAKSILAVTHNNEESVLLADRIVVLGANPGCIRGEVKVNIPMSQDKKGQRFVALVDHIYTVMANPQASVRSCWSLFVQIQSGRERGVGRSVKRSSWIGLRD
jgi:hypothetical protein